MARLFIKVYYEDLARDYPEVFVDDAVLVTWLRLLVTQDKMWPQTPPLPRSAKARTLKILYSSGLVIPVPPDGYRIKGYQADRLARQDAARNAARMRWGNANAYAEGHAETMPTRARAEVRGQSTESRSSSIEKNGGPRGGKPQAVGEILPTTLPSLRPRGT